MPTATPNFLFQLLSHIRSDQTERWRRGETVRVEHYLALYPNLTREAEALLDLIGFELQHRRENGEQPPVEEYLGRFPELGDALHRLWTSSGRDETPGRSDSEVLASTIAGPTEEVRPSRRPIPAPTLSGFEMQEKLGESGMGVVYKARDLRLNQLRAIKFVRATISDEAAHERFGREAKAAARLDHPGVVRIYAMGEHEGELFICMEYLEGGTLHGRLRRGLLEVREAAELVRQLALAVQHAHDNKVLHRDLKPANVLLTIGGVPKVADFGLAKLLDEDDGLTIPGDVMGTPSYMAPEQAEGRVRDVGERADVWALGAILYECLTGRPPFKGEGRSETMELVKKQAPVPPHRLRAEVPIALESICLKCLEKRPEARYATAAELADDLQAWLDGKPIRIPRKRSRKRRRLANILTLGRGKRHAPWGISRKRRWLAAILTPFLLAALIGGVFSFWPRYHTESPPAPEGVEHLVAPGARGSRASADLTSTPDVWIPLLERKPDILCWPIPGMNSLLEHHAARRDLKAYCEELGLLALGETTASRYQLSITMSQTPWDSNIGLFFGYRTEGSGDEQTQRYQTLTLHTSSANIPGQPMFMAWYTRFHSGKAQVGLSRSHRLLTADIPSLTPGKHSLTMTVGPNGLENVTLDDQKLTQLCAAELEKRGSKPPKPADYKGRFGIYLHGNNGTFSEARYRFHKDPP